MAGNGRDTVESVKEVRKNVAVETVFLFGTGWVLFLLPVMILLFTSPQPDTGVALLVDTCILVGVSVAGVVYYFRKVAAGVRKFK